MINRSGSAFAISQHVVPGEVDIKADQGKWSCVAGKPDFMLIMQEDIKCSGNRSVV